MCNVLKSILAVAAVASTMAFVNTRGPASIEGVWRPAEVTLGGPEARTITVIQPNLDIITAKHYSRVEIHAEGPRPSVADATKATAEELRQAWGPVTAEAGSYALAGNEVTMYPVVAKNPASMAPGVFATYRYRVAGDSQWLTVQRDQRGPVTNPPTIKLVRVE